MILLRRFRTRKKFARFTLLTENQQLFWITLSSETFIGQFCLASYFYLTSDLSTRWKFAYSLRNPIRILVCTCEKFYRFLSINLNYLRYRDWKCCHKFCVFIKFAYYFYTFIYCEICLCRETGIIFIRHPFSVLNDTKKRSPLSPQLFAIRQSLEAPIF